MAFSKYLLRKGVRPFMENQAFALRSHRG
jgi:hypothetical protein